ncbi:bifunctional 4-hydroxy-2-oxoglutarate aldolase/2-dehydro-3-deoxy-phosphogluconate aldolase [Clostridium sp. LP20]|uniref:bifunctional 4-hydroxy-2-oxoglutarate aldolase/2-dehydro-3-deoxy-phosphogluconate aldolase n=1 Tax=Clostridium sp. LP20 TaxID=3418665 RepID=UPI003EE61F1E
MCKNIYESLIKSKAVAVIRTNTYEEAKEISLAAIEGGINVIEVTMTVPSGAKLIKELKESHEDVIVGAGTVLKEEQLKECAENKADFIVSPCLDEEIVKGGAYLNLPVIPGVMTMSELNKAYSMGVKFVKVFPGNVVGKGFIKAAKSIYSDINIMPTGGVSDSNFSEWLEAGADCFGIGSDLNKIFKTEGSNGIINYCKNIKARI